MISKFNNASYFIINKVLNSAGYEVVEKHIRENTKSRGWRERLKQVKKRGFSPKSILDGGAFKGYWSQEVAHIFPGVQLIIVEPNPFVLDTIRINTSEILPIPNLLNIAWEISRELLRFIFGRMQIQILAHLYMSR